MRSTGNGGASSGGVVALEEEMALSWGAEGEGGEGLRAEPGNRLEREEEAGERGWREGQE